MEKSKPIVSIAISVILAIVAAVNSSAKVSIGDKAFGAACGDTPMLNIMTVCPTNMNPMCQATYAKCLPSQPNNNMFFCNPGAGNPDCKFPCAGPINQDTVTACE